MESPSREDAARMAAEVEAANAEMAKRAVAPVWYHPALGLLTGGLVAVQGMPLPVLGLYYVAFFGGLILLVRAYKQRTGIWVNGYRKGRTRLVSVGLAAIVGAILLASVWLQRSEGMASAPWIGGAVAAVVVTIGGFLWESAFRRDLRDGRPV